MNFFFIIVFLIFMSILGFIFYYKLFKNRDERIKNIINNIMKEEKDGRF